jgi:hypothetical protein
VTNGQTPKPFTPPKRPPAEQTPSESGTLAGFTKEQADYEAAHDLFEAIKTARAKAAEAQQSQNLSIDLSMQQTEHPVSEFLRSRRFLGIVVGLAVLALAWNFLPKLFPTQPDSKAKRPVAANPFATSNVNSEGSLQDQLKPKFDFNAPPTATKPSPVPSVSRVLRPNANRPPVRVTPVEPPQQNDAERIHDEEPPPLMDDFRVEPAPAPTPAQGSAPNINENDGFPPMNNDNDAQGNPDNAPPTD